MSSRSNIDMATRAQIIALHNQGLNYSEISRETGLNVSNVLKSLFVIYFIINGYRYTKIINNIFPL